MTSFALLDKHGDGYGVWPTRQAAHDEAAQLQLTDYRVVDLLGITSWRIAGMPDLPGLNVLMLVDTTAPAVVDMIESAAASNGIELERQRHA